MEAYLEMIKVDMGDGEQSKPSHGRTISEISSYIWSIRELLGYNVFDIGTYFGLSADSGCEV